MKTIKVSVLSMVLGTQQLSPEEENGIRFSISSASLPSKIPSGLHGIGDDMTVVSSDDSGSFQIRCLAAAADATADKAMLLGTLRLEINRFATGTKSRSYYEFTAPEYSPLGCPTCRLSVLVEEAASNEASIADATGTSARDASRTDSPSEKDTSDSDSMTQHASPSSGLSKFGQVRVSAAISQLGGTSPPGIPLVDYCAVIGWKLAVTSGREPLCVDYERTLDAPALAEVSRAWRAVAGRDGPSAAHRECATDPDAAASHWMEQHMLWRWPKTDSEHSYLPPQLAPFIVESLSGEVKEESTGSSMRAAGPSSADARDSFMQRAVALVTRLPEPHTRVYAASSCPCTVALKHHDAGSSARPPTSQIQVCVVLVSRSMSTVPFLRSRAGMLLNTLIAASSHQLAAGDYVAAPGPDCSSPTSGPGLDRLVPWVDQLQHCSAPATISPGLRIPANKASGHASTASTSNGSTDPKYSSSTHGPPRSFVCVGRTAADWSTDGSNDKTSSHLLDGVDTILPRHPLLGAHGPTRLPLLAITGRAARLSSFAVLQGVLGLVSERRTIVIGKCPSDVSATVLAFLELLLPMQWELPVLPLVPGYLLSKLLAAPVPFLYGCTREAARTCLRTLCGNGKGAERETDRSDYLQSLRSDCKLRRWYTNKQQHGVAIIDADTGQVWQGKLLPALVDVVCPLDSPDHVEDALEAQVEYVFDASVLLQGLEYVRVCETSLASSWHRRPFDSPLEAAVITWACLARLFAPMLLGAGNLLGWRPGPNAAWFTAMHCRLMSPSPGAAVGGAALKKTAWSYYKYLRRVATSYAAQILVERLVAWENAAAAVGPEALRASGRARRRVRGVLALPTAFRDLLCTAASEFTHQLDRLYASDVDVSIKESNPTAVVKWCAETLSTRMNAVQSVCTVKRAACRSGRIVFSIFPVHVTTEGDSLQFSGAELGYIEITPSRAPVLHSNGSPRLAGGIALFSAALVGAIPAIAPTTIVIYKSPIARPEALIPFYISGSGAAAGTLSLLQVHLPFDWSGDSDSTCEPGAGELTSMLEHELFCSREDRVLHASLRHAVPAGAWLETYRNRPVVQLLQGLSVDRDRGDSIGEMLGQYIVPTIAVLDVVDALCSSADDDVRSGGMFDSTVEPTPRDSATLSSNASESQHGGARTIIGRSREQHKSVVSSSISPDSTARRLQHAASGAGAAVLESHPNMRSISSSHQGTPEFEIEPFNLEVDGQRHLRGDFGEVMSFSDGDDDDSSVSDGASVATGSSVNQYDPGPGPDASPVGKVGLTATAAQMDRSVRAKSTEAGCMDSDRVAVMSELHTLCTASPLLGLVLISSCLSYCEARIVPSRHIAIPSDVYVQLRTVLEHAVDMVDRQDASPMALLSMASAQAGGPKFAAAALHFVQEVLYTNTVRVPISIATFLQTAAASTAHSKLPTDSAEEWCESAAIVSDSAVAYASGQLRRSDKSVVDALVLSNQAGSITALVRDHNGAWQPVATLDVALVRARAHQVGGASTRRRRASADAFDYSDELVNTGLQTSILPERATRGKSMRRIGSSRVGMAAAGSRFGRTGSFRLRIDTLNPNSIMQPPASLPGLPSKSDTSMASNFQGGCAALAVLCSGRLDSSLILATSWTGYSLLCILSCTGDTSSARWSLLPSMWLAYPSSLPSGAKRHTLASDPSCRVPLYQSVSIVSAPCGCGEDASETELFMQNQLHLDVFVGSRPGVAPEVGASETVSRSKGAAISVQRRSASMGAVVADASCTPAPGERRVRPCHFRVPLSSLDASDAAKTLEGPAHGRSGIPVVQDPLAAARDCDVMIPFETYGAAGRESGAEAQAMPAVLCYSSECQLLVTTGVPDLRVVRVTALWGPEPMYASVAHASDVSCAHCRLADSDKSSQKTALLASAQQDGTVFVRALLGSSRGEVDDGPGAATALHEGDSGDRQRLKARIIHQARCHAPAQQVVLHRIWSESKQWGCVALVSCSDGAVRGWPVPDVAGGIQQRDEAAGVPFVDRPGCLLTFPEDGDTPPQGAPVVGIGRDRPHHDRAVHFGGQAVTLSWPCGSCAAYHLRLVRSGSGSPAIEARRGLAHRSTPGHSRARGSKRSSLADLVVDSSGKTAGRGRAGSSASTASMSDAPARSFPALPVDLYAMPAGAMTASGDLISHCRGGYLAVASRQTESVSGAGSHV